MEYIMRYTNGIGHLIMSLFFGGMGMALIVIPYLDASTHGIGVGLVLTVAGAWFVPGAAKQVAYQVEQVTTQSLSTSPAPHAVPSTEPLTLPPSSKGV